MMLLHAALFMLWLTTISLSTPLHTRPHHVDWHASHTSPPSLPKLDRHTALAAQAATRRKFQNAPSLLAGLGTSPGYVIPPSLQMAYNRASDCATNITLRTSLRKSSQGQLPSSAVRVVAAASPGNPNTTIDPLQDETDGIDDIEYYGPMGFGSQEQVLRIDFDTGSAGGSSLFSGSGPVHLFGADLWVTVDCDDCGTLASFQANASTTFKSTTELFFVAYGSGSVLGTLAEDTVSLGPFKVHNQSIGAVRSVSANFANSPNDGLAGLAFGAIATSRRPTVFENLMSQLQAPLFSVYMTRAQARGSEILFGGIDVSKAREQTVSWVPVVSKTYWTVHLTAAYVNDTLVNTGNITAIVDTGTSFIYVPSHVVTGIYPLIPGSAPAPDYGGGFYAYPCNTTSTVSLKLGSHTFALDPRDFNLGRYAADPTGSMCIAAVVDAGPMSTFAILGDSFLKSYVSVFDYSHGGRVGFLKSINE